MRFVIILLTTMTVGCAHQQVTDENAPESVATRLAEAPVEASNADTTGQAATQAAASSSAAPETATSTAETATSAAETATSATEQAAAAEEKARDEKAAADLDALQKWAQFQAVNKFGETVYCRRELITGSRLQTRTRCLTATEAERIRTQAQDTLSDLSRRAPRPRMDGGG